MLALKYEGLDLAVLKRLFSALAPAHIEAIVRAKPTGSYARRIWFLYEWLMGKRLDLLDAERGAYEPVVDREQQWAVPGENSPRHRVLNNLPGTPVFCPLVFRTEKLDKFAAMNLAERAQEDVARVKVPKSRVVNLEGLIGDEQNDNIVLSRGAVFHRFPLGEPDKAARPITAFMGHQGSLQDIHTVCTGMCVPGVNDTGRITN